MSEVRGPVLVVVSYYDARPVQPLDELLRSLFATEAGWPFAVRVVVNQDGRAPTDLAARHPSVQVLHRRNAGYNIGAWEHGWRGEPAYDAYLFLQHECVLQRNGWLRPFVEAIGASGTGLVGERVNPAWDATWAEVERRFAGHELPDHHVEGRPATRLETYRRFFASHGIDPGARADHLQALALCARRETLVRMNGLPVGRDYGEAIAAEIAISKQVQSLGLAIREVGPRPFWCFSHPQWAATAESAAARRPPATAAPARRTPRVSLTQWLDELRARGRYRDKPWLVLGKGPTFGCLTEAHRAGHHLLGLNHVVRELPLALAHVIDIDVVQACAGALRKNCDYLLLPRVPHVDSAPGERLLEDWFHDLPVLDELDRQGRLVWYNCSTARSFPGSPVIEVEHFSSEAAFAILARLGSKTVRSLGIDGGRQYGRAFADLAGSTRLQNGQRLFDAQFARIDRIVAAHGIDYAPLARPIHVRIDGGERLAVAAKVLEYSIVKHSSQPVEFSTAADRAPAPADAIHVDADAIAAGDIAGPMQQGAPPPWLQSCRAQRPWLSPRDPAGELWVDLYAEAVNAGVVPRAVVRRAIARGDADRALLRLPPPVAAADASAAARLQHRARCVQRELANMRLSLTFRLGRLLLSPALVLTQLLRQRRR